MSLLVPAAFALSTAIALAGCSGGSAPSVGVAGQTAAQTSTATVIVHYPTGYGHDIALRGSGGGLNWSSGTGATWTPGDAWTLTLQLASGIELKPLFDDSSWAIGPNWTLQPGQTLDMWPHFFTDSGTISRIDAFYSNRLQNSRGIWVYLPPSYAENGNERYPVVYLHDGQNLFYDQDSFSGVSWNVGGAMDQGARDGSIHEAIVIGVENDSNRISEYTPVQDPADGGGGETDYLAFLTDELKPQMDSQYRTLPARDSTALVGSSLGGLASVYGGIARPDVFGLIGALSPSTWWDNNWIIGAVAGTKNVYQKPIRAYLDSGDSGTDNDDVTQTTSLAQAWRNSGFVTVDHVVQAGGQHGEYWWRQRLPGALAFLLGPR